VFIVYDLSFQVDQKTIPCSWELDTMKTLHAMKTPVTMRTNTKEPNKKTLLFVHIVFSRFFTENQRTPLRDEFFTKKTTLFQCTRKSTGKKI
jgi:hypothetical protein